MTESEDHAADETRYACMSRPWAKPKPKAPEERLPENPTTMADLHAFYERKNRSLD